MAQIVCLVSLIAIVSGHSKKAKNALGRGGTSSGHVTKLDQSKFSLDIYERISLK